MQEEIQLENCLGIQSLASQYSLTNLKSKVDNFISWNFMDLCVEEEFGMIPGRQLGEIISQDKLHVNEEEDGVGRWALGVGGWALGVGFFFTLTGVHYDIKLELRQVDFERKGVSAGK
jgi:hypothetical protein